jgi:hypothetical protein
MEESIMVMEKARPHLLSLSQLASQLNKATDLYMSELKEIEEQLNRLKLGVFVELNDWIQTDHRFPDPFDVDSQEPVGVSYRAWTIGYGKHYHDWCILLSEYKVSKNDDHDPILRSTAPLLEASRDLRLSAAEKIPDLLKEIEKEVRHKIETVAKVSDR